MRQAFHRLARPGALGLYCLSCVTMAAMSLAALGVVLGVAGARPVATPLDSFLDAWGLPLLVVSVGGLLWTMRGSPRPPLALVAAGGLLTIAGMLAMGPAPASVAGSMAGMGAHPSRPSDPGVALLFWLGAGLLLSGYVWAWRRSRNQSSRPASQTEDRSGSGPG